MEKETNYFSMRTSALCYTTPVMFDIQASDDEYGDIPKRILYSEYKCFKQENFTVEEPVESKFIHNNEDVTMGNIEAETISTREDYMELCQQFSQLNGSIDPKKLNYTHPLGISESEIIMKY